MGAVHAVPQEETQKKKNFRWRSTKTKATKELKTIGKDIVYLNECPNRDPMGSF